MLGSGSWGTALAVHLARLGHRVALWARKPEIASTLCGERTNRAYLAGIEFPPWNRSDVEPERPLSVADFLE